MRAAQTDANVEPWIDGGRARQTEPISACPDRGRHGPRVCRDLEIRASKPVIDCGIKPNVAGNTTQVATSHWNVPHNRRLSEATIGTAAPLDRTGRWCAGGREGRRPSIKSFETRDNAG